MIHWTPFVIALVWIAASTLVYALLEGKASEAGRCFMFAGAIVMLCLLTGVGS